jgi:nucleosome binding factor SPN SPT16 subunit
MVSRVKAALGWRGFIPRAKKLKEASNQMSQDPRDARKKEKKYYKQEEKEQEDEDRRNVQELGRPDLRCR